VRSSRGGPCCCCQSGSSSLAFPLFYLLWPERAAADLHHPFPTHPGLPRLRLNSTCGRPGSSRGSRRGPHEHGHSLWLPSTSDVCPMRRGVPRLRIRPGAYPRTLAKAPRRLQQGQDRRGPDGVGSIRLSRLWSRSVFYTLLLAGQLRSLTDIPFFVCYYPICSDGICPDLSKAPPDLQKMAESLKRDEAFDVQQIISSAFPDEPVPRRVSTAGSSRSGPSSISTPVQEVAEEAGEGTEGHQTALRLSNIPTPTNSNQITPGYEVSSGFPLGSVWSHSVKNALGTDIPSSSFPSPQLGGYAFPADVSRSVALDVASSIDSGHGDPLLSFQDAVQSHDGTTTPNAASTPRQDRLDGDSYFSSSLS
jgi:hypothetical protein